MDMGVVRSAVIDDDNVKVEITPTYSGCPAMDVIGDDIKKALKEAGYESEIELILLLLGQQIGLHQEVEKPLKIMVLQHL